MLQNPGFEKVWDGSHSCLVALSDGTVEEREVGNIFTPPGWLVWFYHDDTFAQPEVRDAWKINDPRRVKGGEKAVLFFTFGQLHLGGLLQQVQVGAGATVSFGVYIHAWSNHKDPAFPHGDDPRWSEGAGYDVVAWTEGDIPPLNGDPQNDAKGNVAFSVGIDPTGGTNPMASSVEWGELRYNYNEYLPTSFVSVEAEAKADTITVFIRSMTLFPFKHLDAYFDSASLSILEDPPSPPSRGSPRIQYERTYVLLPPQAGTEWVEALSQGEGWDAHRYTIGGSADDSAIGDLDFRRVVAVNPQGWPSDLGEFYTAHYPDIEYVSIECGLGEVAEKVRKAIEGTMPPLPPANLIGIHVQEPTAFEGYGDLEFVRDAKPSVMKLVGYMEHARLYKEVSPDTLVVYRQFTDYQDYWKWDDRRAAARAFLATFLDSLHTNAEWVDYAEGLNEVALQCGYVDSRFIEFECWFAEALAEEGYPARPLLGGVAVGNPEHRPAPDLAQMRPMVEASIVHGGALNYHGYIRAAGGVVDWEGDWYHYAGRAFESWDPYFVSQGLKPRYILGETGAFLTAAAGWKHHTCLDGNWNAYGALLLEFQRRMAEWNAGHDDRCLGGTLFTYLKDSDWEWYNLYGYAQALAGLLSGEPAGRRHTYAKSMAWYYGDSRYNLYVRLRQLVDALR